MKTVIILLCLAIFLSGAASLVGAEGDSLQKVQTAPPARQHIDTGNSAWMLAATALVMLITPGLALFYGGLVRRKNVLGTMMQIFVIFSMVSIVWVLWGYSLAFGPDLWGIIGSLDWFGLNGVGQESSPVAAGVPHLAVVIFQCMFAAITPALITGAFAERMKFSALIVFSLLWLTLVYCPLAHWVWGGGWMGSIMGVLDFAGGAVVHISSAAAAIAAILVIGNRRGHGKEAMPPHSLAMTVTGAALIWFGWFGFNAGSALSAGGLACLALVNTNTAAGAGALAWLMAEWRHSGKPTLLGLISGALAGLIAITPGAGFVHPLAALLIGFIAGIVCYLAVNLRHKLGYDDSLDVIGMHGTGGIWGALATGLFASLSMNPAGNNGLFYGNPPLIAIQSIAVVVTAVFVFCSTLIILKAVDWTMGLRVDEEDERIGLDESQHRESGYNAW